MKNKIIFVILLVGIMVGSWILADSDYWKNYKGVEASEIKTNYMD